MKNEKLNIGIFIDTFFPMVDGVINVVNNHATELSKIANVTVIAPQGRTDFDDNTLPYKVIRCSKKLKLSFLDYDLPLPKMDSKFLKKVNEIDFDIIHIHSPFSMGKLGVKIAKKKNIPVVATLHSQYKKDFYMATKSKFITAILMRKIMSVFDNCNECFAVSKEAGKIFYKEYGLKRAAKLQSNATDFKYLENNEEIEKLRNEYKIGKDEKILLFVGRIHKLKNIFFIIDVLKKLHEKNVKFKMIFIGDGPDFKELKLKIAKYKIDNKIILTGKMSDKELLMKHYKLADLFVFPSTYDTFGLVKLEAASQGTPIICLKDTSVCEGIIDNFNGYICDFDETIFANKVCEILSNDEKLKEVSENSKALVLTWEEAVQKVYEDYLNVIENYKSGKYLKKKSSKKWKT